MTKKQNITRSTLIGQLAKQRTAIFSVACEDGNRPLTDEEIVRHDALGSVIANTPPENGADRAVLADIAYERIERMSEGHGTREDVQVAYAALRAVWLARPENKRAA